MKRKLTALALTLVMALTLLVPAAGAAKTNFPDIPSNYWATESIVRADQSGWMNGYPDGTFRPEDQVTGAEFLTMVTRAFVPGDIPLKAAGDQWYAPYLTAADRYDLRDGAQLSTAKALNAPATRYQMAAVLANLLDAAGIYAGPDFQPALIIGDWRFIPYQWMDSVAQAYCAGLLTGVDAHGTFAGDSSMTRAQAATVLCRSNDVAGVLVPGSDPNLNQSGGSQGGNQNQGGEEPWSPEVPPESLAFSDADLVAQANRDVMEQYWADMGFKAGAYFQQDWTPYTTVNGLPWFRVTEPGITTMADAEAVWHQYFASFSPMPTNNYKMINGVLCTSNQGIGSEPIVITIDRVLNRTAGIAVLQGWMSMDPSWGYYESPTELHYHMAWDNGKWMCSDLEFIYD